MCRFSSRVVGGGEAGTATPDVAPAEGGALGSFLSGAGGGEVAGGVDGAGAGASASADGGGAAGGGGHGDNKKKKKKKKPKKG